MNKAGRNVATSQRHDVGSTRIKVNKRQRRDISSSQRLNVATLQPHDVSASFCLSIIKCKGGPEFEGGGSYELGHENQSSKTLTLNKGPTFVFSSFRIKSTDVL